MRRRIGRDNPHVLIVSRHLLMIFFFYFLYLISRSCRYTWSSSPSRSSSSAKKRRNREKKRGSAREPRQKRNRGEKKTQRRRRGQHTTVEEARGAMASSGCGWKGEREAENEQLILPPSSLETSPEEREDKTGGRRSSRKEEMGTPACTPREVAQRLLSTACTGEWKKAEERQRLPNCRRPCPAGRQRGRQ